MSATPRTVADGGAAPPDMVDPRAPRFGQAITALGLAVGILLQQPLFIYVITGILAVSVLSRWRLDLYALLWRRVGLRIVGAPTAREHAAPHRFAKLLGALFTAVASVCLLVGSVTGVAVVGVVGYAVAAAVVVLAVPPRRSTTVSAANCIHSSRLSDSADGSNRPSRR